MIDRRRNKHKQLQDQPKYDTRRAFKDLVCTNFSHEALYFSPPPKFILRNRLIERLHERVHVSVGRTTAWVMTVVLESGDGCYVPGTVYFIESRIASVRLQLKIDFVGFDFNIRHASHPIS